MDRELPYTHSQHEEDELTDFENQPVQRVLANDLMTKSTEPNKRKNNVLKRPTKKKKNGQDHDEDII